MKRVKSGIAIVGPGRLGQALGRLLARQGFPVRYVAARRLGRAQRAARFIGRGRPVALAARELTRASVVLLTVSDSTVEFVASALAPLTEDWSGRVVLHTCGSLPAAVLEPLRRRGAAVGSLHPFQTIPDPATGTRNLLGCYWAFEGDAAARKVAVQWVKSLRGVMFSIHAARKTLYHLSAFLVSPTTVTLMDRSLALLGRAGVPARVARPMLGQFVSETVKNFVERGARRSLTGPASRGDWTTLAKHLQALRRESPELIPLYSVLVRAMLRLGRRKLPRSLARELS